LDTEFEAEVYTEADDIVEDLDSGLAADAETTEADVEPVEPPSVLNYDEFAGHVVQVGDEQIPLSELRDSGLRMADYTRKTQELADQRREFEQATTLAKMLEVNPRGTIEYLAQQNGLTLAQAQAAVDAQSEDDDDDWMSGPSTRKSDPLSDRLAQIENRFAQEDANQDIRRVFDGLKEKYGDDFNAKEVAKAAHDAQIYDPSKFEMVFTSLAYQKQRAATGNAKQTVAQQQAAATAQRKAAATRAATATGASGSAGGVVPNPTVPQGRMTTRQAAELAWSKHNPNQ
tara:strand:- start:517 stop:1377 length:861 start_codon:yes stop_codon:yes gene_type:complete